MGHRSKAPAAEGAVFTTIPTPRVQGGEVVAALRGTTKDAKRASKARSKHSTHSGALKLQTSCKVLCIQFFLRYNANNAPKRRAFANESESQIANCKSRILAWVSVEVVPNAQKPVCDLIYIP